MHGTGSRARQATQAAASDDVGDRKPVRSSMLGWWPRVRRCPWDERVGGDVQRARRRWDRTPVLLWRRRNVVPGPPVRSACPPLSPPGAHTERRPGDWTSRAPVLDARHDPHLHSSMTDGLPATVTRGARHRSPGDFGADLRWPFAPARARMSGMMPSRSTVCRSPSPAIPAATSSGCTRPRPRSTRAGLARRIHTTRRTASVAVTPPRRPQPVHGSSLAARRSTMPHPGTEHPPTHPTGPRGATATSGPPAASAGRSRTRPSTLMGAFTDL